MPFTEVLLSFLPQVADVNINRLNLLFNESVILWKQFAGFKIKKMKTLNLIPISLIAICAGLSACNDQTAALNAANAKLDSVTTQLNRMIAIQNREDENKKNVADFYQALFGDKDTSAIDRYIGDTYTQHNPGVADGKEALKAAVTQWFKGAPKEKINIQHLAADSDLVFIHLKSNMGGKTASVIDIFKLKNGKIIEHWDVIQEVPAKSANPHPMF